MRLKIGREAEKLVFQYEIYVDWNGSGDTTLMSEGVALANALTSGETSKSVIILSPGDHTVDNDPASISVDPWITIKGAGAFATRVFSQSTARPMFEITDQVTFQDFQLQTAVSGAAGTGVRIASSFTSRTNNFTRMNFKFNNTTIEYVSGTFSIRDCTFDGCLTVIDATGFNGTGFAPVIENCVGDGIVSIWDSRGAPTIPGTFFFTVSKCAIKTTFFGGGLLFRWDSGEIICTYNSYPTCVKIYEMSGTAELQDDYCTHVGNATTANFETTGTNCTVTSNFGKYKSSEFSFGKEGDRPSTYFDITLDVFVNKNDSKSFVRVDTWKWFNVFGGNA